MSFTTAFRVTNGKPVKDTDYAQLATNWDALKLRLQFIAETAYRTTDNLTVSNGAGNLISWEASLLSLGSIWAIGTPTKLIVPTGIAYVRLACALQFAANANTIEVKFLKNGSTFAGGADVKQRAGELNILSAPVAVSAADYFEVSVDNNTGGNISLKSNGSWFGMETWAT